MLERALQDYLARPDGAEAAREREIARRRARTDAILAEMDALISDEDRQRTLRLAQDMYDERGLPAC